MAYTPELSQIGSATLRRFVWHLRKPMTKSLEMLIELTAMKMNIRIVGARKYQDRQSVLDLVNSLPADSVIVTSGCAGVCTWVKEEAEKLNMEVIVFSPDLENIRAWFEVPKRYYKRNREMVETCDFLHDFISQEDGFTGGTRFEVEYALKLKKPVQVHWENGISETFYQYPLQFMERAHAFFLAWQEFFCKTDLEI